MLELPFGSEWYKNYNNFYAIMWDYNFRTNTWYSQKIYLAWNSKIMKPVGNLKQGRSLLSKLYYFVEVVRSDWSVEGDCLYIVFDVLFSFVLFLLPNFIVTLGFSVHFEEGISAYGSSFLPIKYHEHLLILLFTSAISCSLTLLKSMDGVINILL